jgi:hypothetical protein
MSTSPFLNRLALLIVALGCAASFAAEPASTAPALEEPPITEYDRQHWAYLPLTRPQPPAVKNEQWVKNPIDRFILARLEQEGLTPLPPADSLTLIRRLSFDLTGLPPTPDEVEQFLQSAIRNPQSAIDTLVDRLLASPHYGERYAQHWLDLARFAETDGFEHDAVRPQAWKYRDWVVDALNRDLPYDEFLRLQVAGDELLPEDEAAAIATGFVLCGPDMPDLNLQEERRHNVLNEMTSTIGSALLGLQIGCAQCHDHKYDPLSQADFYRLRAVFETAELFKHPTFGRVLQGAKDPPKASYLMVRGDFRRPGAQLEAAFPRIANPWQTAAVGKDDEPGRRAALARWLTRPDHPLVTRVIVNRLWQYHFGRGLVRTPSDFGQMGETPSHPELLDWLATELPRRGWSLKEMHRLMVTSATYQQASRPQAGDWTPEQTQAARESWQRALEIDPANRLLARMNRLRLDGESIRDAMLLSAQRLSTRRGGPGVMPPLPTELLSTLLKKQWEESPDEEDHRRRSIYLFVRRNLRYPLFDVFDRPDTNASCPERNRSTTAPQALWQLNSEFSLAAARDLAAYLISQAGQQPREQIALAYRRTLCRPATDEELKSAIEFLARQTQRLSELEEPTHDPAREALAHLCLALFNLNEFIYLD